ncbi:hypothetical protein [Desulfonatronovibrio magnus]|uniref:hypothetical protein n=1 Tax=Desulfonatronovibrio magnus TaxID=698827 RepID=UPI0005EBB7B1|nr:hypothetical protein [Desulfonatronovibrio magnus]
MSSNLRILKKYGILIEDDEGWVEELERIPNRKKAETFKQWKTRTFGENVKSLKVYAPYEPASNTQMSTLAKAGGSDYLIWAFRNYRKMAEEDAAVVIEEAKEEIVNRLTTTPRTLLREIIDDHEQELEQPAKDFLKRYINEKQCNLSTRDLLTDLIKTYSKVVKRIRDLERQMKKI